MEYLRNLENDFFLLTSFIGHHSLLEEVGIHSEEIYYILRHMDCLFIYFGTMIFNFHGLTLSPEYIWNS